MKKPTKTKLKKSEASKKELIDRLIAQASLDFKCCGHGGTKGK